MMISHRCGVIYTAAGVCVLLALLFLLAVPVRADQTVSDVNGLLTSDAIAQIDARNKRLSDATGLIVAVVVVRTAGDNGALDAVQTVDSFARGKYAAIVWVATDSQRSDIVFGGDGSKWVAFASQDALRDDLATMRYCCPSETVPRVVDEVATAMEAGSQVKPSSRNYVQDDLNLLTADQAATIVAREEKLEAATGKGVGVVLFRQRPDKQSGALAFAMAQSLNVKGVIAAVVWVARSGGTYDFDALQAPQEATIADATLDSINKSFQADMQTSKLGDAIVAAVDRTASALEATSTPLPSPTATTVESGSLESALPQAAQPALEATSAPTRGASGTGTAVVIFLAFALIVLFVTLAVRRQNR
jgi:uncharacterized membrane protein YgcG